MTQRISFRLNRASDEELARHLRLCDSDFVPPLSGRVDISDYAQKMFNKATRFEAWSGELVGLLAAYCNDRNGRAAYVTSISIMEGWRGRGIAVRLLERCIGHAKEQGFHCVELEVDRDNIAAVTLYTKQGFVSVGSTGKSIIMRLNIDKGGG